MTKPTTLYRYFDKDNTLLYVGISVNAFIRMTSHSKAKWSADSCLVKLEQFLTREMALEAEKKAIIEERPLYNIKDNPNKAYYRDALTDDDSKLSQTTIRFTPEIEYKLRMTAAKEGLSKASWIRQLVLRVLGEK